jgi:transposase
METDPTGQVAKQTRSFGATVPELLELGDWLASKECTTVVMESTGSYWKPVYNLLEGQFELMVVNAQHIKAVLGRKTDVKDAEWLAELLRQGLLKASLIPAAPQRQLRDLTRYRTSLVQERAREVNRLQKVLEDSNIKLASVVTDVMGVSARAILAQLLAGETDPQVLADLARGRLREKRVALAAALSAEIQAHHRFMLTELLGHIDYLEETIKRLSEEVAARLDPFEEAIAHLDTIPGVNRHVAEIVLAEVGPDMSHFKAGAHLASWLGLCPGNRASGGSSSAPHGIANLSIIVEGRRLPGVRSALSSS